jgi:hypothetical protein
MSGHIWVFFDGLRQGIHHVIVSEQYPQHVMDRIIANARNVIVTSSINDNDVRIDKPLEGVPVRDQPLIGALSSGLVDCLIHNRKSGEMVFAQALMQIARHDNLSITATVREDGILTRVTKMDFTSSMKP